MCIFDISLLVKINSDMNSIVKEIHNSASQAQERLLKRAERVISDSSDESKIERINSLKALGFTSFKEAEQLSPEKIEEAKKLKVLIETYQLKAPSYRFMTDDAVIELCKKYGLLQGPIDRYTDSIPDKNQQHIIDFKIDDSLLDSSVNILQKINTMWPSSRGNIRVRDMGLDHIGNALRLVNRNLLSDRYEANQNLVKACKDLILAYCAKAEMEVDEAYSDIFIRENRLLSYTDVSGEIKSHLVPASFYTPSSSSEITKAFRDAQIELKKHESTKICFRIIAAPHMFDMTDMIVSEDMKVVPEDDEVVEMKLKPVRIPDPIVQVKVKGGWLNVTAWGEEAELDESIDFTQN